LTFLFNFVNCIKIHKVKNLLLILAITLSLSVTAQSFEVRTDTINMTDANGKRQGLWIVFGKNTSNPGYQPEQKVSEGKYKDNRKVGVWIDYFPSGNIKNKMTYIDGRPNSS